MGRHPVADAPTPSPMNPFFADRCIKDPFWSKLFVAGPDSSQKHCRPDQHLHRPQMHCPVPEELVLRPQ